MFFERYGRDVVVPGTEYVQLLAYSTSTGILVRQISIVGWKRLTRSLLEILLWWTYFTFINVAHANTTTELNTQVYNFVPSLQVLHGPENRTMLFKTTIAILKYKKPVY